MRAAGKAFLAGLLLAATLPSGAAAASTWLASVDERQGLPAMSRGGAAALSSAFAFWGKDWAWAGQQAEFKVVAPFDYSVAGRNQALQFDLAGRIRRSSARQMVWEFDLNALKSTPDAVGGGIVFRFNSAAFASELGEPELLPANQGWTWGRQGGSRVEMRFDPPLSSIQFESRRKTELRAFFYQGAIPQGPRHYVATLSVSGDVRIGPTEAERFGPEDPAQWPAHLVDWKTSPVDLSFLNAPERPAGKHGFLQARKDELVFEDGTPARFWGTNLTAGTLFGTTADNVRQQARRLSELGFNLVRLHHHDSAWVSPNIFGERKADTRHLSPAMLERLDWWIKCLKDEGIYVWLDLHVGRQFKLGDGIDGFAEISKGKPTAELKGYNYVNASIRQAMKDFDDAYVNHANVHTGLRYKEDPAIVTMLVTNENDLTQHYGNALLPSKGVPQHSAVYMREAESFARSRGLPADKVWRSWEPGPSKLFLNDLEYRFDADMIAHLRAQGVKVPVVTTSTWGANPLSSLPALTAGNIIDAHSYGGAGELEKNPVYAPSLVHWIAAARIAGRPVSATEWNVEGFPARDRHSVPLYVAATASHQGWNALVQYAYSQVALNSAGAPSNWAAFNDPAMLATLPAAALLYRRGDVREATDVYAYAPTSDQLFRQSVSAEDAAGLRTAVEKGKLVIVLPQAKELPWLEKSPMPQGARVIVDPRQPVFKADAAEAVSDTGELRRNWEQGILVVDSPRSQAATGWIGGKKIDLADVSIVVTTRNATVAVQSLSDSPIRASRKILISVGARSVPQAGNRLPYSSEPVEGRLSIGAPGGLKLHASNEPTGEGSPYKYSPEAPRRQRQVPKAVYEHGRYLIDLDRDAGTYWLLLR